MVWAEADSVTPFGSPVRSASQRKAKKGCMVGCFGNLGPRQKPKLNRKPSVESSCSVTLFHRISNQVWNFVLPESGKHSFHVVAIGTSNQRAFLDNVELGKAGQTLFEGPDGTVLRLKPCFNEAWVLLVNECMVENAAVSGNGLRDLRSLPDGEYTIADGFDAGNVVRDACRKFKFLLDGENHEVAVAHQECVWQVSLDGKLVDQESHTMKEDFGKAEFQVSAIGGDVPGGVPGSDIQVPARLEMSWSKFEMRWAYQLQVGGVNVPAYWNKVKGFVSGIVPPMIFSTTAGALPENPPEEIAVEASEGKKKPCHESLPRGVSYDREAKTYQANIMDPKTKRYVFLGEFASAELAHKKYVEALERFAPDKKLAPGLLR